VNDKLERIWKEAVVKQKKVLSWNLSGGTEKNYQKFQSGYSGRDLKPGHLNTKQAFKPLDDDVRSRITP
jgi:hypothetical protein